MARAAPTPARSPREREIRRARRLAAGLQGLAYVMMLLAVWGAPVRAVMVAMRSDGSLWTDPWQVWAMVEWTVAWLAGSYLFWALADTLREGLPPRA